MKKNIAACLGYILPSWRQFLPQRQLRYHASTKRFTLQSTVFIATFSPCRPRAINSFGLYKRLFGYLKQYWRLFALSLLALAVAAATEPAFARLMKPLVDGGFVGATPSA